MAGELVVMEVKDFQFPAVNNLVWDLVNEVVVLEGKLFEIGQPSDHRG